MHRVGLIGLGHQTQSELLPALRLFGSEVRVVAGADDDPQKLSTFTALFPEAQTYADFRELIQKEELDAVIAAVPHHHYLEISQLALERNIPVLKEKPMAATLADAQQLSSLSQLAKLPLFTITKRTFYPAYVRGQELLPRLGIVYQYSARHFIPHGNIYEGWRSQPELSGGGVFLDMGYHLLDVLVRYFGEPTEISMLSSNQGRPEYQYEVEDAVSLLMQHRGGLHGCFQVACLGGPKTESLEVRGSQATMTVTKDHVLVLGHTGEVLVDESFEADGVKSTWQAMQEFFRGSLAQLATNLQHNLLLMQIIDRAYRGRHA